MTDHHAATVVQIPLTRGKVALIDAEDLPLVGQYKWCAKQSSRTFYAARAMRLPDGRRTVRLLHTLLTCWPMVDHINGDGLDNRRANLRPASRAQNSANRRKGCDTSSRFKGVCWHKLNRRWHAQIKVDSRWYRLGYYLDDADAAQAYDTAARHYFGEFAAFNFPEPGERSGLTGALIPI